jgi:hypothetical protein
LRLIALVVATVCVLALAAGTFALSYPGARATAINAGVDTDLARIYPGIFDAVLLVACAAALSLRRVWRFVAWLVLLVVIGALAAADTTHTLSIALPRRPMEATAAAAPWALLVIGLILLDAMARQSRPSRRALPPGQVAGPGQTHSAARYENGTLPPGGATTVPLSALLAHRAVTPTGQPQQPEAGKPAEAKPTKPQQPEAGKPAEAEPGKPQQPEAGKPAEAEPTKPQQPEAGKPAEAEPTKPQQPEAGKPAEAEPTKPQQPEAGKPAEAEPTKPQQPEAGKPASTEPGKPQQAEAGKPAEADPPQLPEPTPPQLGGRDEPSDADAEPSEPSAFFRRLRRSLVSPGRAAKDAKQASTEPAAGKPPASKEPTAQSPKAASGR